MDDKMIPANDRGAFPKGCELPDYTDGDSRVAVRKTWLMDPLSRRRVLRAVLIVLALLALIPVYRMIKEWRACSLMGKSGESFALGDPQKGLALLKQALALSPGSPRILSAVELYNARSGDASSLEKLIARMRTGHADEQELLGIAEICSARGSRDVARQALALLTGNHGKQLFLRRSLLEASMISREKGVNEAVEYCMRASGEAADRGDSGYLRIQAALNLLSDKEGYDAKRVWNLLEGVVNDRSSASVQAWRILSQLVLSPPKGFALSDQGVEAGRLEAVFPKLSGTRREDELLSADLAIKCRPDSKSSVVSRLMKSRKLASRADQLDLARWLNGRGCQKEVIMLAGERPKNDTDWLLVALDAKTSLGEWDDIPPMLATPAGSGIQDAVRHLYLARIAMLQGDGAKAEEEWRNVGGALHLEKPETLAYIAGYQEQIGLYERAARTYREMAEREGMKVTGLIGIVRCQPPDASAKKLIPIYQELSAALPDNSDVANDLTYLRLLANDEIAIAAAEAEKLLLEQPNTLTRISAAALGRLRRGDFKGASDVYRNKEIPWGGVAFPWRAVRVAVLRANREFPEAKNLADTIDQTQLRPEERELLAPTVSLSPR